MLFLAGREYIQSVDPGNRPNGPTKAGRSTLNGYIFLGTASVEGGGVVGSRALAAESPAGAGVAIGHRPAARVAGAGQPAGAGAYLRG